MALARARTAISLCSNGFRQISARRFCFENEPRIPDFDNGRYASAPRRMRRLINRRLMVPYCLVALGGLSAGYYASVYLRAFLKKAELAKEADEKMRKMLVEELGLSRESCEATIAEMNKKIESGSASKTDRYLLEKNEEWLEMLSKGK